MKLLGRLMALYRAYWGWMALGTAAALLSLLANVALMAASGWFITAMAVAGAAGVSMNYFAPAGLIRACAMLRTGGRYAERLITHEATFRLIARIRVWLFRQVEPQSAAALQRLHSGDMASRLKGDVDRLETAYLRLLAPVAVALLGGVAVVAWLALYGRGFAAVEAVLLVLCGFVLPLVMVRLSAGPGRRQVRLAAALTQAAVDGMQGLSELLAFGAAPAHRERFAGLSRALIDEQLHIGRLGGLSGALLLLGGNLALWLVVVLAIPVVRRGGLDAADMVMVALAALAAFESVAPLPAAFLAVPALLESAGRVFTLADACPPSVGPSSEVERPERCDISLAGVGFGYDGSQDPVFRGLSLDLPQGRRMAVLGPVGSGKSTLVHLLTGLLVPSSGQIRLNGRPLEDFPSETLRRCFAVAPQDAGLFSGTVGDILRLGRPEATDAELWRMLAVVGLADFVSALPQGLESWLGEAGMTVSGGQARRLAVARALLRDAPVVVLDEPGEGLDYRSERSLLQAVMGELGGRSLLLITHRAAGLGMVDEIVRMPGAAAAGPAG